MKPMCHDGRTDVGCIFRLGSKDWMNTSFCVLCDYSMDQFLTE